MPADPRDSLELRLTLRRIEAAEAALSDARQSLNAILERQTAVPVPEPAPVSEPRRPLVTVDRTPPAPPVPAKPAKPAKPPVPTETKVIRAIAVVGTLITVAGVGLAVALAIQAGLLGPLGRVLLSTLLAAALLGAGLWLDNRRRQGTDRDAAGMLAGVTALLITAWLIAAVILYALLHILEWWPAWAAVLALMVVWLGMLALAVVRQLNAVALCLGLTIAPVVLAFHDPFTPTTWLVLLMPLSLLAVTRVLDHPPVRMVAGAVALLVHVWLAAQSAFGDAVDPFGVLRSTPESSNVTIALLGMISATAFAAVTLRWPAQEEKTNQFTVYVVPLGLLVLSGALADYTWVIWLLVPAAIGLAYLGYRQKHDLGMVGVCATAVAFLIAWDGTPPLGAGALIDDTIVVATFFIAAVLAVIWLERQKEVRVWPWAFWLGAALIITYTLSRNVLTKSPLWLTDHIALVQAVLIAVFLGVVISRRRALVGLPVWAQVAAGVAGLHLSMVAIVTAATWLGHLIAGNPGMWLGYLIGHALVSVLWMVLAAWILLAARGLSDRASLGAGMVLAIAGVIKLVFFDLGTLEGLPRALAFLASGLALLAMASLRTRRRTVEPQSTPDRN